MPPPLIIEVIGDTSSLERSFKKTANAAKQFSGSVKEQASRAIVANVEQRQALEKLAAEYRLVARNARQGSEVQIASARLAENAERQLAASFGVVNHEARRASGGFRGMHGELGKASRGALAGSGVFRGLGRSIAFASGGFLAFATAGEFLRKSIDAAKEAQVTQAQLAAQFRASGQNLGDYQAAIEKTTNRLSLLAGFQNDELKAGFTTIFRTTGNASKSLRDLALSADLARAKHLGFAQAALIVAKTEAGNTTLLRRQGFQIDKNATSEKALAQVRAAVAGQARAGTTAQERLGAVLHNTEEIIGTALLPTLNKYLNSLARWLTKMNESGRLQRDVEQGAKLLSDAITGIKAVLEPLVATFRDFAKVVGGTANAVKILTGAFVLLKLRAAAINFGLISSGIAGIGTDAVVAGGRVGGLRGALQKLSRLGPITVGVAVAFSAKELSQSKIGKKLGLDFSGKDLFDAIKDAIAGGDKKRKGGLTLGDLAGIQGSPVIRGASGSFPFSASSLLPGRVSGSFQFGQTRQQRLQVALAQSPDDVTALRAMAQFDREQIAAIKARGAKHIISAKKYTAQLISFYGDLNQQESHLAQIAADQKKKADAALARARKQVLRSGQFTLAATIPQRVSGSVQFLRDSFAAPLRLQLEEARAAAQGKTLKPILLKMRAAARKALASGRLALQGQIDALNAIASINDQLKKQSGVVKGKFTHVDPNKLLAGRGLTPEQIRGLAPFVAQIGFRGKVPGTRSQAFASGDIVLHTHVSLDGREVATSVTRHQQKHSQRRSNSRRGPYAGRH